jgi:glucokinase
VDGSLRRLGLDLGATDIKFALLDDEVVVETGSSPTRSAEGGPTAVLGRVVELGRRARPVETVGLSVPGLVDAEGRAVLFPNMYGEWAGVQLARPLSEGLELPVALVNDGHAFALAEARIGAARGWRDVICVVCGTGVGGGLVLGGELRTGIDDRAGEIGHHTVLPEGERCGCGNRGCLETIAGSRAIARAGGYPTFAETLEAAREGEEHAAAALERAGRFLGIAIANLALFLTPDRVVVGGGVAEAGDLLLGPLRDEVNRRIRNVAPRDSISIVRAELGPFAGAIGAALGAPVVVSRRQERAKETR